MMTRDDVVSSVAAMFDQTRRRGFTISATWNETTGEPTTDPETGRLVTPTTPHNIELVADNVSESNTRQYNLTADSRKYIMQGGYPFTPAEVHTITVAGKTHAIQKIVPTYDIVYEIYT